MGAGNTDHSFGWVTRTLHWAMALAILGMLGFGTYLKDMDVSLSTLWLFGLHKSIGLTLLALVCLRLLWHWLSPPPEPLREGVAGWQLSVAHWTHRALYALMLAVPLSGWIASAATGIDVVLWNTVTLPAIAPVSESWEKAFFLLHRVLTRTLMVLLILHVSGALVRHLLKRDRTLHRMVTGE